MGGGEGNLDKQECGRLIKWGLHKESDVKTTAVEWCRAVSLSHVTSASTRTSTRLAGDLPLFTFVLYGPSTALFAFVVGLVKGFTWS